MPQGNMTILEVNTCHVIQSIYHELRDLNKNILDNTKVLKDVKELLLKQQQSITGTTTQTTNH